ncbi:MAG: amidohydrolase family protein [Mycobacterium sp.]|nr:amidohydrolase family protein [Mycobacterium sp.]
MCINCDLDPKTDPDRQSGIAPAARNALRQPDTATVFRGGAVYTLDSNRPWASAVAVSGKTIIAVGSDAEATEAAGPDANIVELDGRMLLPGFIEGHIHPLLGGFFTSGVDLQLPTKADVLAAVAAYAKANPQGPVRGFGWRMDMVGPAGPQRDDLDAILPDRPVLLVAIDAHSMWVNSATLEQAGITRDTPDPVPGFSSFGRGSDGEPNGFVLEAPAMIRVLGAVEPLTRELLAELFSTWAPKAAAAGITAMFDAGMPPVGDDPDGLADVYTELEASGLLPFRVVVSHLVKEPPIEDAVDRVRALRDRLGTELVTGGVLKIVGDGTLEGHTGYLLEPYADLPDSVGQSPFSEEQWHRLVAEADAAGLDLHVHAIGDRTTRIALDAIAAAIAANPPRDRRHTIAHLELVDDTDLPRLGQLGVIGQFSSNWMAADAGNTGITLTRCGPDRYRTIYRPRTVLDGGATISFGTDWPAASWFSTYKPLDAIETAVTRQSVGQPDMPVLEPADERLDLAQALEAATLGPARQLRLDHLVGSIEPGKRADLVVLRQNLFEVEPHQIAATPVDMTMMNGCFTYGG